MRYVRPTRASVSRMGCNVHTASSTKQAKGGNMVKMVKILICCCCGKEHEQRDRATDPWEGRMDGYCNDCSDCRCDTSAGMEAGCPNDPISQLNKV